MRLKIKTADKTAEHRVELIQHLRYKASRSHISGINGAVGRDRGLGYRKVVIGNHRDLHGVDW